MRTPAVLAFVLVLVLGLGLVAAAGCAGPSHDPERYDRTDERPPAAPAARSAFYAHTSARRPSVAALTALGRELFFDPSLSRSGRLACATCHDPAHAYGPPDALAALPGLRAVPSLRYLQTVPRFTEHFHDADGDDGADQGPAGGLAWDGRAQTAHEQARLPLFSPLEMANASEAELVARVARAPYAPRLRAAFGDDVLATDAAGMHAILLALEVFQQSPPDFAPYDSKYDAVLRGRATLTPAEARGRALFDAPTKGNCARCHPSTMKEGAFPAFTDFGFAAIGVPRNRAQPVAPEDLGLCGPLRTDLADHPEYCGMFRTPSLRNTARRPRWFHDGALTRLTDVVRFYATRDTAPEQWYPHGPTARDQAPLDREAPFGGARGGRPALTEPEIADVVAFLGTLDDGYGAR